MLKPKVRLKLFIFFLVFLQLSILFFSSPVSAKADDLIIDDNGSVTLVITGNTSLVMGTSTIAPSVAPQAPAPAAPATPAAPANKPSNPPKVVPIAPANSQTTVKITPPAPDSKKLNITIETKTNKPVITSPTTPPSLIAPTATQAPKTINTNTTTISVTNTPTPSSTPVPANVESTQKTVDNVILRNANEVPVITIKANENQNGNLSIQQQGVKVDTKLPLQIDSKTHVVSVDTSSGPQSISILPDQAVKGANDKITVSSLKTLDSKVSLTETGGQPEYVVSQTKQGKFLGIFTVSLPSEVKISAKTGRVLSVWQSPLTLIPGLFTK